MTSVAAVPRAGRTGAVHIGAPTVDLLGDWTRVTYPVEGLGVEAFWYEVAAEWGSFIEPRCDPALVALILPAMLAGRPVVVDGPLTSRVVWHVRNTIVPVLARTRPELTAVAVTGHDLLDASPKEGRAVVTGLSCGVDSLAVCADHLLDPAVRPEDRITHFLFNDIGSHGERREERAERRFRNVKAAAASMGCPVIRVRSNMPDFYPDPATSDLHFMATQSLRNASVPLLLQRGIRRWLFASSGSWAEVEVRPNNKNMGRVDPILLPVLGTGGLDLASVGQDVTRIDKTRQIAGLEVAHRHLDVCTGELTDHVNCGRCRKCLRTFFTLELLGALDAFDAVVDLDVYRAHRRAFVTEVLADRRRYMLAEVRALMDERGYRAPTSWRAKAALHRVWRRLPDPLRTAVRKLRG